MAGGYGPARAGTLPVAAIPPPQITLPASSAGFRNVGWLLGGPDETALPSPTGPGWVYNATPNITSDTISPQGMRAYKVAPRDIYLYSDPMDPQQGSILWRLQSIVRKAATQYGSDYFALGHYAPFKTGIPVRSIGQSGLVESSGFQPISRGGHVLISQTEMAVEGGPAAAMRRFANTRMGLWFKSWVIGGANIRPLGSQQTPSPQFRGVLPNYGYITLPRVIGS